jgi:hypothetical protein
VGFCRGTEDKGEETGEIFFDISGELFEQSLAISFLLYPHYKN